MALNPAQLTSAIQAIYDGSADTSPVDGQPDGPPTSNTDAGNKFAKAYADYAAAGMFGASTITLTTQEAALATVLGNSLVVPGLPATHAAAWSAGLTAFWVAVPVVGAQAGATVGCPGAAALVATLTTLFANLANTPETAAAGLAGALATATATVTAAVAPPPGTILPIA